MQSGTLLFVVGTTALTLPSLMSTYYLNLGLSSPLFSPAYIRQHGFFTFQSRPSFAISGPSTSLVTHMFHHVDIMQVVCLQLFLYSVSLILRPFYLVQQALDE